VETTLEVDLTYVDKPKRYGVDERELVNTTIHRSLPADSVALVLVDLWDRIYVASHLERARGITREVIASLADAFRNVGAAVVHAPCPSVAEQFPEFRFNKEISASTGEPADWPPADFRNKRGEYAEFALPSEPATPEYDAAIQERKMSPLIDVRKPDVVVANGPEMHAFLKDRGVLWLFYCGFATNVCVLFRDYGMVAMARQYGYEVILVRDATTGIETAETADGLKLTEGVVGITEHILGYSTTSGSLMQACEVV
jgi:nicotinamidase-related amidase